jgi:hypothetical protein
LIFDGKRKNSPSGHLKNQSSTIVIHQSIGVVPQERWFPGAKIRRGLDVATPLVLLNVSAFRISASTH